MQSATSPECIPALEFPEIPNKDELVVSGSNLSQSFLSFETASNRRLTAYCDDLLLNWLSKNHHTL